MSNQMLATLALIGYIVVDLILVLAAIVMVYCVIILARFIWHKCRKKA